jgi:hypothetical protein
MTFFRTNAGKAIVCVTLSALLFAWPPALPWVVAVALLQQGVKHLVLAFREAGRDLSAHATVVHDLPALHHVERELVVTGGDAFPARSQVY